MASDLYFVSDMPGGYGGTDLYVCRDQGGQWGEPENLGSSHQHVAQRILPVHRSEWNTLYFSSNGHPGLGGIGHFRGKYFGLG
jgi:hypothetical protein